MITFNFDTDADPDLNDFSEIDVEETFKRSGTFQGVINTLYEVDSLQRWMRDAKPGARREYGRIAIICRERTEP